MNSDIPSIISEINKHGDNDLLFKGEIILALLFISLLGFIIWSHNNNGKGKHTRVD